MSMPREAVPGAMKLPPGAIAREKFEQLEETVRELRARVAALEEKKPSRGAKP